MTIVSVEDHERHNVWRITVIMSALVVYSVTIVFIILAWVGDNGIFTQSTFNVLFDFPLEITPAEWIQWLIIPNYAIQAAWLLYGVSTICRKAPNGMYIYQLDITPPWVYILFIFGNLIQISWLFAWDREVFVAALSLYSLLFTTLTTAVVFSVIYLNRNLQLLKDMKMKTEINLVQNLVQGALITYTAIILNYTINILAIVMTYRGIVSIVWSSTTDLIIRTSLISMYFVLDVFLFQKYLPPINVIPYGIGIISLAATISVNFNLNTQKQNSIFILVVLILYSLFLIIKVLIILLKKVGMNVEFMCMSVIHSG